MGLNRDKRIKKRGESAPERGTPARFFGNKYAQSAAAVLFSLALWQAAASAIGERILLASPVEVLERLFVLLGEDGFAAAVTYTFTRIVAGFFLGLSFGVLLAVAAGRFAPIEILLRPIMATVKSVPVASFIVIALIWLSSAKLSVFISFLIVLPVVYSNVLGGIRAIPRQMTEMADIFRLPWHRRLIYIWLPEIKQYLLSACAAALGMSWKAGVAAEIIGIPTGSVGEALYEAKLYLDTEGLLAWTVVVVLVSVLFEKLFMLLIKFGFGRLEKL